MKKLSLRFSRVILFVILLQMLGSVALVLAQPQPGAQNQARLQQYRLLHETNPLNLVSTSVATLYLPLVFGPPPPKKGLGAPISPACVDLQTLRASWYLNWTVNPDVTCGSQDAHRFVPRITSAGTMNLLPQAIINAQASGWLIGFTEPNLPTTALSPTNGAILWKQIEDAALPAGIKLVSPSPSQHSPGEADPWGNQWIWYMVDAYRALYGHNPHFDALAWNIYKENPGNAQGYLIARHNEALARGYNVPFWILEYGGECWKGGHTNTSIVTTVTPWFEATPWIARYAWFASRLSGTDPFAPGWQSCSLINPSTGAATTLGRLYAIY